MPTTMTRSQAREASRQGGAKRASKPKRRWLRRLVLLVVAVLVLLFGPMVYVWFTTSAHRVSSVDEIDKKPVAIVFGAGLRGDRPSPYLARRLDLGVELWKAGKVSQLLLSGDSMDRYHDEVGVMRRYVLDQGVPAAVIRVDPAGYDTYATCRRAVERFDVDAAVVVTQTYHLPRAVYTCRQLGIDAQGIGASGWQSSPGRMVEYLAREALSSTKAVVEVTLRGSPPPPGAAPRG